MSRFLNLIASLPVRAALALALFSVLPAVAATVQYTATQVAGTTWEYEYTVSGKSFLASEGLTIYFEPSRYGNLNSATAPGDWDLLVLDPDVPPGANGMYDVLALVANPTLTGFSIRFDFLGKGAPGAQKFEIYSLLNGFSLSETGMTVPVVTGIPEPGSALLVALGLGAVALGFARSKTRA